jgi:N-acetylmuramoyl-L-alanine amidase
MKHPTGVGALLVLLLICFLQATGCRPSNPPAPTTAPISIIVQPTAQITPTAPLPSPTPNLVEQPPTHIDWRPGTMLARIGDEIMVCGQLYHTNTRVILWTDPDGYDAYRTERRFAPWDVADYDSTSKELSKDFTQPNRFGIRKSQVDAETFERIRGGGWDLPTLQKVVDQSIIHDDACGTSRQCFNILQDHRGLSVHFMLDLDGTIYQTLDVKERAWHATTSNSRSIGIEIANIGAYPVDDKDSVLDQWYRKDSDGRTRVVLPAFLAKNSGIQTEDFVARPIRNEAAVGMIQGKNYRMYDLTPQQYQALIKLTATICTIFPKINCDAPRDGMGNVINHVLPAEQLKNFQGVMGHYHLDEGKEDPGPAFEWDRVIYGAQSLMTEDAKRANRDALGHPALPVSVPATTTAPATTQATSEPASAPATIPTTNR